MQQATEATRSTLGVWRRFVLTLEMIRFEHSVFALPFALTGAALAWRHGEVSGAVWVKLGWIVAAMVGARSAAMAFNRLVDAAIDARNPRTRMRHLPAGLLSRSFAWGFFAASVALFLAASAMLNPLCLRLAPLALAVVLFYSWTKRFTSMSHIVLGLALGIAPGAAWIAMTGGFDARMLWLTAAVTFWTAGFDIIYSCQDTDFDLREGLHSIPARLGIRGALNVSRLFHVVMVGCLSALAWSFEGGAAAWAGVVLTAALLLWEHRLVRHDDLSRVDAAFFTVNGWIGILYFACWAVDLSGAFA
ncbi:MAG: UbiA family prenyltransferase [Bryobacteraceae bacterium]|nr:UbiA family prenyltransferase [Bryobacteraceae bacterium]